VGNASLTNSVKFTYKVTPVADWAPDTLNGLLVQVQNSNGSPQSVSFDIATFAQAGEVGDTNGGDYGVGNYLYVKTSTNTAQLTLTNTAPPNLVSNGVGTIGLVFTNHYQGLFTNQDGESGGVSAAVSASVVPGTLGGRTLVATKAGGGGVKMLALSAKGTFRMTPPDTGNTPGTGTYVFKRYSPVGGMLVFSFTDAADAGQTTYVQVTFRSAAAGSYLASIFDNTGALTATETGTFVLR
jgi:hypothetical protein